jgi:SAM-dependent methyltransferase
MGEDDSFPIFVFMNTKLYIKTQKGKGVVFKKWILNFLSYLDHNSTILDVGSGLGYNADFMEKLGFKVVRSDVNEAFILFQKKPVIYFDVLMPPKKKYDAIFMCLVLSMFSPIAVPKILKNLARILEKDGLVTFNVPSEWSRADVKLLMSDAGLKVKEMSEDEAWKFLVCSKL